MKQEKESGRERVGIPQELPTQRPVSSMLQVEHTVHRSSFNCTALIVEMRSEWGA
jgi:hypothetical protein